MSLQTKLGQGFNQEGKGDLKGIYSRPQGHFHANGLQHLGNDEATPHLGLDDHSFAAPDQMQSQGLFQSQEGQFNVPSTSIEPGNLHEWQDRWIADIGEVLSELSPLVKLDLPNRVFAQGIPTPKPDKSIEGFSSFIIGMHYHYGCQIGRA